MPLFLLLGLALPASGGEPAIPSRAPETLRILGPDFPRAFFFRASEGAPRRNVPFEPWDAEFSRLMGIMGKCLDEEVPGTEAHNPEFFTRFKQCHPEQVVMLHFNGNSRNPDHGTQSYFPGHWIYRKAVRILADVPAEEGETEIRVEDERDFQVGTGRYRNSTDDIGLFALRADGRHDWNHCEQVKLVSVDARTHTIRVKRGCCGTKPLAFPAGQARAAAHQVEGPWGKKSPLLWYYNFSTHCPRDAQGKTCADRLVEDLAAWFGPGGKLAAFDGLEFDVMFHETHGDTDGDGELDNGVVRGVNQYGIGMIEFARQLRERMGEGFLIQGDGALGPGGVRSQRAWGLLNGIESEGFPNLNDWDMEDWSGGLNRHGFWQANARPPAFHYINHKWVEPIPGKPGEHSEPEVPLARHRLSFAAAQFTDAMICYSFAPKRARGEPLGIWDELTGGAAHRPGWLGRPLGPAQHLAAGTPDLLQGAGNPPAEALAARLQGEITVQPQAAGLLLRPDRAAAAEEVSFSLRDLPAAGEDLVVQVTLSAEPRDGYPREMARFVQVTASGGARSLLHPALAPEMTGMALRGQADSPLSRESGAYVAYRGAQIIGDQTLPSFAIHPPYRAAKGAVFWCRDVTVPQQAELRFSLGMAEKSPQRSDGVWFQVWVAERTGAGAGPFTRIFEQSTKAHAWVPCTVPLQRWADKPVRLKFVADCGPQDDTVTDQGFWGNVRLMRTGEADAAITAPVSLMTWANGRPFTSFFHFRGIRSRLLDLDFRVEGAEPVTLSKLTLHAHPDAMLRSFEHGLVLANPGLKPFQFDLEKLAPGVRFRRLQGSVDQDPVANNGADAGTVVTLGERDALFLLRTGSAP